MSTFSVDPNTPEFIQRVIQADSALESRGKRPNTQLRPHTTEHFQRWVCGKTQLCWDRVRECEGEWVGGCSGVRRASVSRNRVAPCGEWGRDLQSAASYHWCRAGRGQRRWGRERQPSHSACRRRDCWAAGGHRKLYLPVGWRKMGQTGARWDMGKARREGYIEL